MSLGLSSDSVRARADAGLVAIGRLRDVLGDLSVPAPKALGQLELELYRIRFQAGQPPLQLELGSSPDAG